MLKFQSVSYYQSGINILKNINWQVKREENWAIIGVNGAGKTMLLRMAAGYLWPSNGQVEILGFKLGEIDLRKLRRKIGWVSSSLTKRMVKNISTLEVVLSGNFATFGLYDEIDQLSYQSARHWLSFFNLSSSLEDRPFSLLSTGEQRKVLIARALINNPELLILDEPCTGLDLKTRENFLRSVEKLGKKKNGPTIIYVTHHIEEIMPFYTHILLLKDGKIFAQGKVDTVLNEKTLSKCLDIDLTLQIMNNRFWPQIKSRF